MVFQRDRFMIRTFVSNGSSFQEGNIWSSTNSTNSKKYRISLGFARNRSWLENVHQYYTSVKQFSTEYADTR